MDARRYQWSIEAISCSGVGVSLKVGGGINIEKREGVGSGGLCPPQFGVWGLSPRKKINFALKLCNSGQVLYFFPILQHKNKCGGGDYPPVLKVGDLSPCPPAPTPMISCWKSSALSSYSTYTICCGLL